MKIDAVTAYHYRLPLTSPFRISVGTITEKEGVIFEMRSGDFTGWGEASVDAVPFYAHETVGSVLDVTAKALLPAISGHDFPDPEFLVERMESVRGNQFAKAGLEAAFQDIYGQSRGISCATLLGGERELVEVGPSIGIKSTPAETVAAVAKQLELGRRRIKLKVSPGFDLEYLRAVRREFPDCCLMADANNAYGVGDFEHLKRFDEFGLLMIEQPLDENDIVFHAKLRQFIDTPVCLDESIHTLHDAECAIALDACDIINIKVCRVGGLVNTRKIHDLCRQHGIANWIGSRVGSGIATAARLAAASLPNCTLPGDCAPPQYLHLADDFLEPKLMFADGCRVPVPSGPGLGITVDRQKLERFSLARFQLLAPA